VSPARIRSSFAAALFVAAAGLDRSASALDPQKALTQYGLDTWQEGLPQLSLHAVAQTPDGYLWIGTQQGLARFDGVRFTTFDNRNTPGLRSNLISALLVDRAGRLWVGTWAGGLSRLEQGRFVTFTTADGLPSNVVHSILETDSGLYVGTDEGLSLLHGQRFDAVPGLEHQTVKALHMDPRGRLWIGTDGGGLFVREGGRVSRFVARGAVLHPRVRALLTDRRGRLWVGTDGGAYRVEGGIARRFSKQDGLGTDVVRAILEDRDGNLWVGGFGGLHRLRGERFERLAARDGLTGEIVYCLYEDREGSLWLGMIGGGLDRLGDGKVVTYTQREGLPSDLVRGILEDRQGTLWVGTDAGLARLKAGTFTTLTTKDGLPHDSVFALAEDRGGGIWVGTRGGLARHAAGTFRRYTKRDGLRDDFVRAILEDREGNLWIGTESGLCRRVGGHFQDLGPGSTTKPIFSISQDREGAVWVSTFGAGLVRWQGGHSKTYTVRDGLPSDVVRFAHEDRDGDLWIGTDEGLALREGERFSSFTSREGLPDEALHQILEDGTGGLWFGSNRGIFSLRKPQVLDVARGRAPRLMAVVLDTADGMRTSECNGDFMPAGARARDGRLYFPTVKGLAMLDPAHLTRNREAPSVVVERATCDGDPFSGGASLPPGGEKIEIRYAALTFLSPQRVRFKYKLLGFDRNWTDAGNRREAFYTNLRPGRYVFQVQGANADGVWNVAGASLGFEVLPHFYQTFFFYPALFAGLLGVLWVADRWRLGRIRAREEELGRLVTERTTELAAANEILRRLAVLDGLTGIANYRRFQEALEAEWRRALRGKLSVSVLMIDIDFFKDFNDAYGHLAGDDCLKKVAGVLTASASRPGDLVSRYGGEEFGVMLVDTDHDGAGVVAERMRSATFDLAIPHSGSAEWGRVTISVGVASLVPEESRAAEELVATADRALYRAKHAGRNRVEG
jgi:diguanylate cyclase (GGDEF)-like protein